MESKDELIDYYGYQLEIFSKSYNMMGRLLDKNFVKKAMEKKLLSDVYIYGGGYLGIQLYLAISSFVNVVSVVDKSGKLMISMEEIPVIDIINFRKQYKDETVIITPLKYYSEIYHELIEFIPDDKIVFLEEFGG